MLTPLLDPHCTQMGSTSLHYMFQDKTVTWSWWGSHNTKILIVVLNQWQFSVVRCEPCSIFCEAVPLWDESIGLYSAGWFWTQQSSCVYTSQVLGLHCLPLPHPGHGFLILLILGTFLIFLSQVAHASVEFAMKSRMGSDPSVFTSVLGFQACSTPHPGYLCYFFKKSV